jgi:hypothetical protein
MSQDAYDMSRHIVSKQRVADHGEVFTPPDLVRDMLDLVAQECERIDSRFLEPACGNGNFLAEVLHRRLALINRRAARALVRWEQDALLGLACLYGIELLPDNARECRDRLCGLFTDQYIQRFGEKARPAVLAAARLIVETNILNGDALTMTTVSEGARGGRPLVVTEWSLLPGGRFKRHLYEYQELVQPEADNANPLFSAPRPQLTDEEGKPVFVVRPVGELPAVHYLKIAEFGGNRS